MPMTMLENDILNNNQLCKGRHMRFVLNRGRTVFLVATLLFAGGGVLADKALSQAMFTVEETEISDFKSVLATVRSRDLITARVRTPGTIVQLDVDEGDQVEAGQKIATVVDDKIAIRLKGIDARIIALETRVKTALSELKRTEELTRRGISPKTRLEQAKTVYEAAEGALKALRAERSVALAEQKEGQVLAPAAGRVLNVPVTLGSVVLPGETIASIAANTYLLRLELPERHALFMHEADEIRVSRRGAAANAHAGENAHAAAKGRIVQVYPQLQDGRVIADAEVEGLGGYFIGERALVWISAGRRKTMLVPRAYVFQRYSLDYVRLVPDKGPHIDVVVQLGQEQRRQGNAVMVEVLSGLRPGDNLVAP